MKTMQKRILFALAALFILALVYVPKTMAAAALQINVSKYEPHPAVPGQTVRVWLLVENKATDSAKDVTVEFVPQSPFSLYGDTAVKTIPSIAGNSDYLIDYTLKLDPNALQGDNEFTVRLSDATNQNAVVEKKLSIYVQSQDSTVSIDSVKVNPQEMSPGSTGTITITVKNLAANSITGVTSKLFFQGAVGSAMIDLPFAPTDSGAEKRISQLNPGESVDFTYNIRVYPDAVSKVYKIPMTLTYQDSLGNAVNKSDYIGVVVNSVPDVAVMVDKTDLTSERRTGSVTLKIVNKGLSDIKFLNVVLQKNDNLELLSQSATTYVGNLESDDYQTVDYRIGIKGNSQTVNIPVAVQYRDANNNYYERIENVSLNLIDNSKLGNSQSAFSPVLIIIIILVAAIGLWIFFKNRAKGNKKGQFN